MSKILIFVANKFMGSHHPVCLIKKSQNVEENCILILEQWGQKIEFLHINNIISCKNLPSEHERLNFYYFQVVKNDYFNKDDFWLFFYV